MTNFYCKKLQFLNLISCIISHCQYIWNVIKRMTELLNLGYIPAAHEYIWPCWERAYWIPAEPQHRCRVSYAPIQYNFFNTGFSTSWTSTIVDVRLFTGLTETDRSVCPRLKRVLLSGKAVLQAYGCVVLSTRKCVRRTEVWTPHSHNFFSPPTTTDNLTI